MVVPMANDEVAAGEGALYTFTMRSLNPLLVLFHQQAQYG